jgi:aminoglycoside/choline kinase family phosphotransferase
MLNPDWKQDFLTCAGWQAAAETPVGEDWSQRKFWRLAKGGKTAILMQAVPDDDPRATPGHKLGDYVRIAGYLRGLGFSTPEVLAQDVPRGLLLVEDFGNAGFQDTDYPAAVDVLAELYCKTEAVAIALPGYYQSHVHTGRRRVVDWYLPAITKAKNPDGLAENYLDVWTQIESGLPPVQRRFLHGDFHPGNMMMLPGREGGLHIGILDFQGAMIGPAPYDLVNLLDDARRIVPEDIRQNGLVRMTSGMGATERESFLLWYPVLAAQFHCRVIGQAIRLALKDNKTRLLSLLPILSEHLRRDFENPVLAPMKDWFAGQGISFGDVPEITPETLRPIIREDAF